MRHNGEEKEKPKNRMYSCCGSAIGKKKGEQA